ncbi:MAG: type II secretion system F family protein [Acidobacteriota bacterium]|nr:type II secretion system F family protein [Acidobacteriota bacterium]
MPYFKCRLAAEDGRISSRSIPAGSADDCRRRFAGEGYCVLSVRRDWRKFDVSLGGDKKLRDRDFITFNQELQALIRAGYPVLRSVEIIAGRTKNVLLRDILGRVEAEIRQGKALSEAFAPFEKRFSKIYIASIMAGETSGNLPETIGQYIQYARTISKTRARVKSALIYPTMLLVFSVGLLAIVINFVLPNFAGFYADFEAQLPFLTLALVRSAAFLRAHWYIWTLLLGASILVFIRLRRQENTRLWLERQKLRLPLGKLIWVESGVSAFSRTMSLLLQAGIPVLGALPLAVQAIPNKYLSRRAADIPDHIRNGETLSESMIRAGFFPQLALDMVRIGETSANLGGMLREAADVFDERIQSRIDTFVGLIEPIMIVFMGVLLAGMLLAVYMPIFNIIRVVR